MASPTAKLLSMYFLRRAFLDITGTIPNVFEYKAYATAKDDALRREKLVDTLLNSPG